MSVKFFSKVTGGTHGEPICPNGWSLFPTDNHCYKVVSTNYTWNEAEDNCKKLAGSMFE